MANPRGGGFCEQAWRRAAPLVEAICEHPFNRALLEGTLERETFAFYLVQDARYLVGFSRALSTASVRAPGADDAALLAASAHRALVVERALHRSYLAAYGVAENARIETSPSCLAYTSYLQATALHEPFAVVIAALVPCFWIYEHVARTIREHAAPDETHPYLAWIETYADDSFAEASAGARAIADRAAAAHPAVEGAMRAAFLRAASYEWMFWESAWRRERWPTARWTGAAADRLGDSPQAR